MLTASEAARSFVVISLHNMLLDENGVTTAYPSITDSSQSAETETGHLLFAHL